MQHDHSSPASDGTTSSDAAAQSYDAVPYRDLPYAFTHPRHLEAMAVLFGMSPTPIPRCRVLELGCAGGGNLIPQALELPEGRFLGIDLSQRQVAEGQRTIERLGLRNIELRTADILHIGDDWGTFDYIVAHGVYSWVPAEVQAKILEVCCRNLAPQGVALVSYNTLPGWHLAALARDLMRYHATQFGEPAQQIAQAKAFLEFLVELSPEKRATGTVLREELDFLRQIDNDSYLFHEHLETHNTPLYFHEFAARAETHGLQYLAEADFSQMLLRNLPEKAHEPLSKLPLIRQEQYMDFVRGRRFRKTLLCHRDVVLQRQIKPETLKQFHFATAGAIAVADVDIRNEKPAEFRGNGSGMSVSNRLAKAALVCLRERYPEAVSFAELYATAVARLAAGRPPAAADVSTEILAANLLMAYSVDLLQIAVHPPRCTGRVSQRPRVSPLAQLQAAEGRPVTNQLHQIARLDPLTRRLIRRLDGRHSRADLAPCVHESLAAGELQVKRGEQVTRQIDATMVAAVLDQSLARLSSIGLLVE